MDDKKKEKVHWMAISKEDKEYTKLTCYRSVNIEAFVNAIERENVIMGINFDGSNICFVLDDKPKEEEKELPRGEDDKSIVSGDPITVIKDKDNPFKNKKKHGGGRK